MIITAQPFFNELDLLEIKCRELEGIVDLHVVVEAPMTYTGIPKPLHFAENKARFAQWPIHHVVAELQQTANSPWDRERRQHEFVRSTVAKLRPEIAMFLDADELPKFDTVNRFRRAKKNAMHIDMDWITFFFDRICFPDPNDSWGPWRGDELDENPATVLANAGWHFDYFNFGDQFLVDKLKAISHAADEGGDSMLKAVQAGGFPGIERTVAYLLEKLPRCVRENRQRYAANLYAQ